MSPIPNQTIAKLFHYTDPNLEKEFDQIYNFLQFAKYPEDSIDGASLKKGSVPENRLRPPISAEVAPGAGGGGSAGSLQDAYDFAPAEPQIVTVAGDPLAFRRGPATAGTILRLENSSGVVLHDFTNPGYEFFDAAGTLIFDLDETSLNLNDSAGGTIFGFDMTAQTLDLLDASANLIVEFDMASVGVDFNDTSGNLILDLDMATPRLRFNEPGGNAVLDVQSTEISFGETGNRLTTFDNFDTEKPAVVFYPDGLAATVAPALTGVLNWSSTYTASYVNNSFGGWIQSIGTYSQSANGFAFNNGLIFNHATTYENDSGAAADFGSFFTLVDQPLMRSTGGARTGIIHNSVRAQPRFGPHTGGGTLTWSNVTLFECAGSVNTGSTITTWRCMRAGSPAIITGSIGTWIGLAIPSPTLGTTRIGIDTDMASPHTFIRHTGAAVSTFAGDIHMNNGISLVLGSTGANRVELLRSAAGVMRMIGVGGTNNEGLDWDLDTATANNVEVTSSTGAGLQVNLAAVSMGTTAADPTSNWQFLFGFGAKTVTLGGDFARVLFSASSNVTVDAALSNAFTYTINDPALTIGTGSVVNAGNVLIQTAPSVGTNRYGLLITSNPSGGTLNYAFRQSSASSRARFDGRLDINRGIALGGGAAATLGTIGGSGPTAAAQAQWVEIDINGVAHWIPVWT